MQEGSLCAQHCLNALLQGEYFTPVDLATLAERLDEEEKQHMAEGGENSEEYRRFLQQPSTNMDDSGFFSVQVIASALSVWNLDCIPFSSQDPIALVAKVNPINQKAFICNYREHWFTIRKLGDQWFNLNSLLTGPELISDTYLVMFLTQLEQEECEADVILRLVPAVQTTKPKLLADVRNRMPGDASRHVNDDSGLEDEQLQAALKLSLEAESLESASEVTDSAAHETGAEQTESESVTNPADVRNKRLAFFLGESNGTGAPSSSSNLPNLQETTSSSQDQSTTVNSINRDDMTDEEMLEVAIKMSMTDDES